MSDKPLVQQALASELAELLLAISTVEASLAFLRAFWEATVREWNGLDRLRLVFFVTFSSVRLFEEGQVGQILHAYPKIYQCRLSSAYPRELAGRSM